MRTILWSSSSRARRQQQQQQKVSWFGGWHSRRKLWLLGLCLSYQKLPNYNLVAEIKPHLCLLLNDSLFQLSRGAVANGMVRRNDYWLLFSISSSQARKQQQQQQGSYVTILMWLGGLCYGLHYAVISPYYMPKGWVWHSSPSCMSDRLRSKYKLWTCISLYPALLALTSRGRCL